MTLERSHPDSNRRRSGCDPLSGFTGAIKGRRIHLVYADPAFPTSMTVTVHGYPIGTRARPVNRSGFAARTRCEPGNAEMLVAASKQVPNRRLETPTALASRTSQLDLRHLCRRISTAAGASPSPRQERRLVVARPIISRRR